MKCAERCREKSREVFDWSILPYADEEVFFAFCRALEDRMPCLRKKEILEDVDGSLIQSYVHKRRGKVTVYDSYYIDAVYVKADFDLSRCFDVKGWAEKWREKE